MIKYWNLLIIITCWVGYSPLVPNSILCLLLLSSMPQEADPCDHTQRPVWSASSGFSHSETPARDKRGEAERERSWCSFPSLPPCICHHPCLPMTAPPLKRWIAFHQMESVIGAFHTKQERQVVFGEKQKLTLKLLMHRRHWKRTLSGAQAGCRGTEAYWRAGTCLIGNGDHLGGALGNWTWQCFTGEIESDSRDRLSKR